MKHPKLRGPGVNRARGFSIVEIMISMVIGLVVVGAVLVSYIGSGQTNKRQAAYAEMNENAQIAFAILQRDLQLAGYAFATGTTTSGGVTTFTKTYSTRPIFGCDQGFTAGVEKQAGLIVATDCSGSGTTPAIDISYEADGTNSVLATGGIPSDCLGNSLNANVVSGVTYYIASNRYYLKTSSAGRGELHCASSRTPAQAGQPLVDNVENMKIWYGESVAANPRQIVRYVTAAGVSSWNNIISVRVCLLMRSADTVLTQEDVDAGAAGYRDCDSASQTSADRYLRRSYFLTTTLRNKMSF